MQSVRKLDFKTRLRGLLCRLALAGWFASAVELAIASDIPWVWYSSEAPASATEIAVLTDTLYFSGAKIDTRHRRRALIVPKNTLVTPTIHVHLDMANPSRLGPRHMEVIQSAVLGAARLSTSRWVQLDFEARESQQEFFVAVVDSIRRQLPETIRLSVTVQAGMCRMPDLLDRLSADEVVPMFFRMGDATSDFRERLSVSPQDLSRRCRGEAGGFAVQESMPPLVTARYQRRYWFNYRNWQ